MKQCENCGTDVTFWMMQKFAPFRYVCSNCKTRYRIAAPNMMVIIVLIGVLLIGMALGLGFGGLEWGLVFIIPCLVVIVAVGFCVEMWLYKYLAQYGTFSMILEGVEGGEQASEDQPEDAVAEESCADEQSDEDDKELKDADS